MYLNIKSSVLLPKALTSEFPARRWSNVKLQLKGLQQLLVNFLIAHVAACFPGRLLASLCCAWLCGKPKNNCVKIRVYFSTRFVPWTGLLCSCWCWKSTWSGVGTKMRRQVSGVGKREESNQLVWFTHFSWISNPDLRAGRVYKTQLTSW